MSNIHSGRARERGGPGAHRRRVHTRPAEVNRLMLLQHTVSGQAQRRPNATAIVAGKQSITYGELEQASNQLAHLLKDAGCEKGDRVGLLSPKSIPTLVGMLATLKADGVYVPMDAASPAARLSKIVEVAEPRCILASGGPPLTLLDSLAADNALPKSLQIGLLDGGS